MRKTLELIDRIDRKLFSTRPRTKHLPQACKSNVQENVRKLADNIQKQVAKVNAMMQELLEIKNV